jgi:Cu2+-exporting ATPase
MNLVPVQLSESGEHTHQYHSEAIIATKHDHARRIVPDVKINHDQPFKKYTCPLHPEIVQDGPGKSPLCRMTLVPLVKSGEPHDHTSHRSGIADFKRRFYVVLVLTIPHYVVIRNDSTLAQSSYSLSRFKPDITRVVASRFFLLRWSFPMRLVREIQARNPGMMTLIGLEYCLQAVTNR